MKKLSGYVFAVVLLAVSAAASLPQVSSAAPVDQARQGAQGAGADTGPTFDEVVLTVSNILFFLVGIAAVIMIIIGAIKYTTANGDQSNITSAKNTILYSIVGLILAVAAGAIVNFVLDQF